MILLRQFRFLRRLYRYYRNFFKPSLGTNYSALGMASFYLSKKLYPEKNDGIHLQAAMSWLARAQDVCGGKGVSAFFDMKNGWDVAYPETSGYIIATFLEYAKIYNAPDYYKRAVEIGDWEIEIQTAEGGILSNPKTAHVRVFNTGQVILGWCLLFERTGDKRYLTAACRAGDFLCNCQEADGRWVNNTYCGPRTYHARIDWALLRLHELTGENKYLEKAEKNIAWVLAQQTNNGWFKNCGFHDEDPIMHVIAYTLRGLLESACINVEKISRLNILEKLIKTTESINNSICASAPQGIKGLIPTSFKSDWTTNDNHSCITGNAQYALYLYRLSQVTRNQAYAQLADQIVSTLKKMQNTGSYNRHKNIIGAIPGSYPFYEGYCPNSFPNWATKFFADAILMKNNYKDGLIIKA